MRAAVPLFIVAHGSRISACLQCCRSSLHLQKGTVNKKMGHHEEHAMASAHPGQDKRAGFTFQIRSAYSRMLRSLENLPMPATFKIAFRLQSSWSR